MYYSTRGWQHPVSAAQAIVGGIAPDGGLYVPSAIPQINTVFIEQLIAKTYQQRAQDVMGLFLPEFDAVELTQCINSAYTKTKFPDPKIAPVINLKSTAALLELWHGPTAAFKDMALQLLPQLLVTSLHKLNLTGRIAILVATSGDTGKAALAGFKDVDQTEVIVFYPEDGVSAVQKLQMVTQTGANVHVVAVKGNFDDAQTGVKHIFSDRELARILADQSIQLSSANSINLGRLLPQIVYYFSAYADMIKSGRIKTGDVINFVVPTGNFGNILAGYYAKQMGLPVGRLICAANNNNVLAEFINSGVYNRNRPFHQTLSPSMDILISSNLERLLYHLTDGSTEQVTAWQQQLQTEGCYHVTSAVKQKLTSLFWSDWSSDDDTCAVIRRVYQQHGYLLDPHTAVAWSVFERYQQETGDDTTSIIVATASPFKFADSVLAALTGQTVEQGGLESLFKLAELTNTIVPESLTALVDQPILHTAVCNKNDMRKMVTLRLLAD